LCFEQLWNFYGSVKYFDAYSKCCTYVNSSKWIFVQTLNWTLLISPLTFSQAFFDDHLSLFVKELCAVTIHQNRTIAVSFGWCYWRRGLKWPLPMGNNARPTWTLTIRCLWTGFTHQVIFKKLYIKKKRKIRKKIVFSSKCLLCHGVLHVLVSFCVGFLYGPFFMVPLNLTYLHCLQHSFFEHLFNLYWNDCNITFFKLLASIHRGCTYTWWKYLSVKQIQWTILNVIR